MISVKGKSFAVLFCLAVAGCGGGGGGGGTTPPPNQAPSANAGVDQVVALSAAVSLSGSGSDPDGSIASYAWNQIGGGGVTLTNATSRNASFTAPAARDVLEFELTVTDNDGAADTDQVLVTVTAFPTANAGTDQTVRAGDTVNLAGAGNDADGSIAAFAWAQSAGTVVTLQGADTATPSFTAPAVSVTEVLQFALTVTDNDGATGTDTVAISVSPNDPPTADAGTDQSVNEGATVTLTGAGSDTDGTIAGYQWSQTAGPSVALSAPSAQSTDFTAPDVALGQTVTLTFRLTVTDNDGGTGTDTVDVVVAGVAGLNNPPTASAGADATAFETEVVTLNGAGSDPDESPSSLTYAWTQTAGPAVTINNANLPQASFTAPAVTADTVLTFQLQVTDSDGASDTDSVNITVSEAPTSVTISGKVEFEFVPRTLVGTGLDYARTEVRPIRGATVQAIASSGGAVLDSTTSDANGDYSLTLAPNTEAFVRVRAELKRTGAPSWDVEVRDNTSNITVPLNQRPLYVLDGAAASSGFTDSTRNLLAETGWGIASYTGPRAAAPFSVLDIIYNAVQLVLSADPTAQFAPLDAFWSVNNRPANGSIDNGDIGTSFYRGDLDSLFLLGSENEDTEEFDTHVIAHEWGHYFEDNFSRADSTGGPHSLNERLDARLAFGEGWGNAVSGMIMGDPVYFDTFGAQQAQGFQFNVDGNSPANAGWFNESSVQSILWDLFDSGNDGADQVSLGFAPLYQTLINEQRLTPALTTIFSFITELKGNNAAAAADIDALVSAQTIDPIADIWGGGETNDGGNVNVLPVFAELVLGAGPVNICTTRALDPGEDGNKLGVLRYLRFTVNSGGNYRIDVTTTNPPTAPAFSDPDFFVRRQDVLVGIGGTGTQNAELLELTGLAAGTYTIEILEAGFPNIWGNSTASPTFSQDTMCFDVSLSQI